MSTECWFRNPHSYIRELAECGQYKVAWDRGTLIKKRLDPTKHAELYFGAAAQYRLLVIGEQGAAELAPGYTMEKPKAVYPVWNYGDELTVLEDLLAHPVGEDEKVCSWPGVPPDELPVLGQEHRVIITNIPPSGTGAGRAILRHLHELQQDYPNSIIHLHGLYSWNTAFGIGIGSADIDPRFAAFKGKVILPNGQIVLQEKLYSKVKWVRLLGYEPADMTVPRNRCMFNIKSAVWAAGLFTELYNFRTKRSNNLVADIVSTDSAFEYPVVSTPPSGSKPATDGDKFICNTCSLADDCKFYREGAVCAVPGAEPVSLTSYFNTRDSGLILDGLAILVKSGIKRYERGLGEEGVLGELIPEVTKIQSQVFDQGVKLAKLIDPSLRGGAKVEVNVGSGSAVQINSGSPRQAIAAAIRELEARGIAREDITPAMIQSVFDGMQSQQQKREAIEASPVITESA